VTARTAPRLPGLKATLGPMSEPLVERRPWTAPEVAVAIEAPAGAGAGWRAMTSLTASTCFPTRGDRWRCQRVRARSTPLPSEHSCRWRQPAGGARVARHQARIGEAILRFKKLRGRCAMTTYDRTTRIHSNTIRQSCGGSFRRWAGGWPWTLTSFGAGEWPSAIRWSCWSMCLGR
jgi:hypothetical protein